jgi:glycerol-3-phosphate acyltransferase PlsY
LNVIGAAAIVAAAYLAGAIPCGVVLGRLFAGTDLREFGSKSTGATNAYRVLGGKFSAAVLVLDILKGAAPVIVARWLDLNWWVIGAAGVAAVAGHCWSVFIGFSGGKGMATSGGAIGAMAPWVLLVFPIMLLIVWRTRYVSLASLTGTALAALLLVIAAIAGWEPAAAAVACCAVAAIVFERHRGNIERLRNGTERKFGRKEAPASSN